MINANQRKRQYLAWVLANYQHEEQGVNFLLNFLMTEPDYIQYIEFSDKVEYTPRGIYISYAQHTAVPFLYYKDQHAYPSYEQAFHDLRLNSQFQKETFYLELNIPDYISSLCAYNLLVEHDYMPVNRELEQQLEQGLAQVAQAMKLRQLKEAVDQALDDNAFERVNQLLQEIEQLEGKQGYDD